MNYLIFDTETTGMGARDEVIQFAGIMLDDNFNMKSLYNFYCDTQQPISSGAYDVHKIDKKLLKELSHGYCFEDNFYSLLKSIKDMDVCWIAYNSQFDKRLINQTLEDNGLPRFNFGKEIFKLRPTSGTSNFCLLKAMKTLFPGKQKHNLEAMTQKLPISKETIDKRFIKLAELVGHNNNIRGFHDALYDVYCSVLILQEFQNKLRC